jgi:hypothetical protein
MVFLCYQRPIQRRSTEKADVAQGALLNFYLTITNSARIQD